ncbi:hypothetical protein [Cellulomonas palmilytica]|uniref:hypothetical protein n=1 Tax=Cellulomonas palmilytica TaxID=2608402 RepID=UPI001F1B6F21|nr:hypothetical protein [Cellulomonas palmilytica]UJP39366.1 hypothetical protein F1D97_13625 [Cellulomonas palmilytica]
MVAVSSGEPPTRSCRQMDGRAGTGGTWSHCRGRSPRSLNYWIAELNALMSACSTADGRTLKAELRRLMQRAEQGDLRFGRGQDVDRMVTAKTVLEIRARRNVGITVGDDTGDRVVRLYFSEPEHAPDMLLAAKLGWKHPEGKTEQNEHAAEAAARVRDFFT